MRNFYQIIVQGTSFRLLLFLLCSLVLRVISLFRNRCWLSYRCVDTVCFFSANPLMFLYLCVMLIVSSHKLEPYHLQKWLSALKANGHSYLSWKSEKPMVRGQILEVLHCLLMSLLQIYHLLLWVNIDSKDNFPKDIDIHPLFHSFAAFWIVVNGFLYRMLSEKQETKQPNC